MRIGHTNYYTHTKHGFAKDPETNCFRPVLKEAYVLSTYGKNWEQVRHILDELSVNHIWGRPRGYIDEQRIPLPHILIIHPQSIKQLEKLLQEQGIDLPEDRFKRKTNFEDVLTFEENKHPTMSQRLDNILYNKKRYMAKMISKKKASLHNFVHRVLGR